MQALLGYTSEARWIRHAHAHLGHLFRYLPGQPGYNRRLRAAAGLITTLIRMLAADTSLWTDDVWVIDSTPVECGRSRDTARRSDLAGWAEYGYCASHSRYFWGLRLHLLCTLHGLPVGFALAGAKADERQVLLDILADPALTAGRDSQIIIGDKNYYGHDFETTLADGRICLLRPARKGEPERKAPGSSSRCARSSSPSTTRSKASSTSSATAATPQPGSWSESCSASSPSPPRSGTTTTPASPSNAHS